MSIFFKRLGGFYKYRFLMQQLVMKDIKLKYRRSILGYLWSILNPLMIMVIMVIVFSNTVQKPCCKESAHHNRNKQ